MKISGGIPVGPDQRVHPTFGHNPSSLRLCCFDPNMQQIPRSGKGEEKWVKDCFVADPGMTLWERDFSGIEAVLVGYFSNDRHYTRLARRDVHSFYTAYALCEVEPGRISPNDLPLLDWPDDKLFGRLKEIKKEFGYERNSLYKHLVHAANFLQTPFGAAEKIFKETGQPVQVGKIKKVMDIYFDLFPLIRKWQRDLCIKVDGARNEEHLDRFSAGTCYVQNPFGYVHRFYHVLDWTKVENEWVWSYGEDARRLVSFLPQSTAAAIIKAAARRLFYEFPWVGETLRLLIHDSALGEAREEKVDECLKVSQEVFEAPIKELPLDPSWNMGEYLTILSEAKVGKSWGGMR